MTHISHFGVFPLKGEVLVSAVCVFLQVQRSVFCLVAMWMVFPFVPGKMSSFVILEIK